MSVRKRRIRKWPIAIFVLLVLGGIAIAGISFAKMINTPRSVTGGQGVAEWSVSATSASDDLDLLAGGEAQSYILSVASTSDVACEYAITVSNVPEGVKVGVDGIAPAAADANGEIVFDGYSLNVRDSRDHTLVFKASLDAGAMTDHDIDIDVEFAQIEPEVGP